MLNTELARILGDIAVVSPTRYACAGAEVETEPGQLLSSLTDFLYWQCYVQPFSGSAVERPARTGPARSGPARSGPASDLLPALRDAHAGQPCREFAWRVAEVLDGGRILARKGGAVRRFDPGHYLNLDNPFGPPAKNQRVAICLPKDSTTFQEGYYYVFSEAVRDDDEATSLLRFYWHIAADGAPLLVNRVTRALGRFQLPYQMKLPADRAFYYRRDAAVLYLNRRYYRIAAAILAGVHQEVAPLLDPGTPLFTKPLERGLALAENPDESFGKSRCRILAQALSQAHEKELAREDQRLEELDRQFRAAGLGLDRPYLNAGSRDQYDFPPAGL